MQVIISRGSVLLLPIKKYSAHFQNSTMAKVHSLCFSWFFVLLCATSSEKTNASDEERKMYIVYMGALPDKGYSPSAHHAVILQEVGDGSFPEQHLVRSYTRSFNAFVANLTEQEHQKLAVHEEVVSIFPSRTLQLLTTESWDFTGFPLNVSRSLSIESDIIIGVIDTGIWPESESFNDHGIGPVPRKWKGACEGGRNFTCNRKIIGARYYDIDDSARDFEGHGSHTASTAAGNIVTNTSFYEIAQGTVRGGVPSARIAVYKVCSHLGCSEQDVLAAFDDAIADGVDILTVSLGGNHPISFQYDSISIGSFHAAEKGILTVNAAGNNGYGSGLTTSIVPWLFSVAASSTKRRIISNVALGNGKKIAGLAVNSFKLNGTNFPLIYGNEATKACDESAAKLCYTACLDRQKVKGKIVICGRSKGVAEASRAGALGAIAKTDQTSDVAFVVPLAASVLNHEQFEELESFYNSTKNPRASILSSEPTENRIAPVVASFSSRGPNQIIPDILKPDITAPGVDILAAYSPAASPSSIATDKRSVRYSVLSGTSMACPHVAGAAAYLKSWHPAWSPSAIKSALMTTAWRMKASDAGEHEDAEFSYGAGHFDPIKALNPGLVYETLKEDYVQMLCSMDFDDDTLRKIFGDNTTCTQEYTSKPKDLNYPSMSAHFDRSNGRFSVKFPRTVTNVGVANSTYKASITGTPECKVTVKPSILSFQALKERKSFVVTVTGGGRGGRKRIISASLEWSDGIHSVRSPIVIYSRTIGYLG